MSLVTEASVSADVSSVSMSAANLDISEASVSTTILNLSPEQQLALEEFTKGKNIFLTGPGGSGKTELIKRMVAQCEASHKKFQVCALTGCAAILLNCKAKTVHSWAGLGLANGTPDEVVRKVISNIFKIKAWKKVDVLIIDEVSMMSLKIFEILDMIGRRVRKKNGGKPFGGIQVVFSGDFYQLPPVGNDPSSSAFCFESNQWATTFDTTIQLKTIFRQTDKTYTDILNQIRVGKLYKSGLELLYKHVNKPIPASLLFKPSILLPKRKDVDLINVTELAKLGAVEQYTYVLAHVKPTELPPVNKATAGEKDWVDISDSQKEMEYCGLINNIMADKELLLKKGTQVMCIANIDMESPTPIVNGSQGVVVEFLAGLPVVQFGNGEKRTIGYHNWVSENFQSIAVKQIPLIHAWAITIHKAQGVSLDLAQIDVGSNIFECGQTYVALSRVKSLEGLYLTALDPGKIKVNRKVQDFYTLLGKNTF